MSEESPEHATNAESPDVDVEDGEDVESEQESDATSATNGTVEGERAGADADVEADSGADADADAEAGTETGSDAATEADVPNVADRVAEYDDDLAADVAAVESRLEDAEAELDSRAERIEELESALKRTRADFKNYKQRAKKRQDEIRERATEDFVGRVVSVRDNLVRALDQDGDADIRPGIESTLEEFDRILDDENVSPIDPEAGETVDPTRHEVLMRVDDGQPEGTVVDVFQPGYEMADSVLREAQVTVSTGNGGDGEPSEQ
ncbi:nucleotide exchange factor GrpE [Halobellus captivus]|uniref:nucleotide exchange factor GrpE n=1 Tax=Halobellus captivus TaxID=2592614 RepID=UPI0011A5DA0C|nr:nucleotide exchange factor GrpE [Halobellus captivus]